MRKITRIILHHTASSRNSTIADIDRMHKNRNWGSASIPYWAKKSSLGHYAQYHYLITADGKVTQCQEEKTASWHAGNANYNSIGIAMTGNFDNEMPTQKQQNSLRELLLEKGLSIQLHRDVKATRCPGKNVTMEWVNNLLNNMSKKNYYCKSELRNELKEIWKDFDHESGSSQKKMAEKLEKEIKYFKDACDFNQSIADALSKQIDTLTTQNRKLKAEQEKLTDQLNMLRLNSTQEKRDLKDKIIKLQDELEEAIETKQGCPGVITWDFIIKLIMDKLTIKKK